MYYVAAGAEATPDVASHGQTLTREGESGQLPRFSCLQESGYTRLH